MRNNKISQTLLLLLCFGIINLVNANEKKEFKSKRSKTFTKRVTSAPNNTFYLELRSADISIKGTNSNDISITTKMEVKGDDEELLDEFLNEVELKLDSYRNGFRFTIDTPRDRKDGERRSGISKLFRSLFGEGHRFSMSTNVEISLPSEQNLNLENRYGDLFVNNVSGDLRMDNSSGEVIIENCNGELDIHNKYAKTEIVDFVGPVSINNSSGQISLEKIHGHTTIENSYREINFNDIQGNLIIRGQSSEIVGRNVGGDCDVTNSYRNIKIKNIKGKLAIRGNSCGIDVANIQHQAIIESSYRPITVDSVKGFLEIIGKSHHYARLEFWLINRIIGILISISVTTVGVITVGRILSIMTCKV